MGLLRVAMNCVKLQGITWLSVEAITGFTAKGCRWWGAGLIVTGGRWVSGATSSVEVLRVAMSGDDLGLIGIAQNIRQPIQSAHW